jgi:8-oxo-dGTP diphosphatase
MKNYTVGFLFNTDGDRVALIRKLRPEWQKGLLNGIGGHVESGETRLEAMHREFREETGLEGLDWHRYMTLYTIEPEAAQIGFFYAIGDPCEAESVTDEQIEVHYIEALMVRPDTLNGLAWEIAMARMACMTGQSYIVQETEII